MALMNVATPPRKLALLDAVPADMRFAALKGANQRLVAEVERLKNEPRRTRALTVESVEEAINWIDDPEALKAIVAHDTRKGVVDKITRKLRDLEPQKPVALRSNEANIVERTARALKRDNVPEALASMSDHDWNQIRDWYAHLDRSERAKVLPAMLAVGPASGSFTTFAVHRVFSYEDDLPVGGTAELVRSLNAMRGVPAHHALAAWDKPADDLVVTVAVGVECRPSGFPEVVITPSAVSLLEKARRWDIIASRSALSPEKLAASMANATMKDVFEALDQCKTADYVDALCVVAESKPMGGYYVHMPPGLFVDGISARSRAFLLGLAAENVIVTAISNDRGNMPCDEVVEFARTLHARPGIKIDNIVSRVGQSSLNSSSTSEQAKENLVAFVDALFEYTPGLVDELTKGYWVRSTWVTEQVMAKVAVELDGVTEGWPLFFSTAHGFAGSVRELTDVIKALQ